MYKCGNCEREFERADENDCFVPYGESRVSFPISVCPHCGSDEFAEAYPCKDCGRYFTAEELTHFYCDDCLAIDWDDTDDLFDFAQETTTKGNINEFALSVVGSVDKLNDFLKLALKFIDIAKPEMLKEAKAKFVNMHKEELAEEQERKNELP